MVGHVFKNVMSQNWPFRCKIWVLLPFWKSNYFFPSRAGFVDIKKSSLLSVRTCLLLIGTDEFLILCKHSREQIKFAGCFTLKQNGLQFLLRYFFLTFA